MSIRPLLAAVVVLGAVLGLSGGPSDATPSERGEPVPVRIGSFNINASVSLGVWSQAVTRFMPLVDVAGLQEVNRKEKTAWLVQHDGWGSYRPTELQQNPVMWNDDVFDLIEGRGEKIADGREVEVKKAGADSVEKDAYATVVRLKHLATGQSISIVNLHLISGAVNNGQPIAGRPNLYSLYADEVAGATAVVSDEMAWADGQVYVLGDFNNNYLADRRWHQSALAYAQMSGLGLVSAWEARPNLLPGRGSGTRGGSYLDNVWSAGPSLGLSVRRTFHVSDHFPIVALYPLLPLAA